MFWTAEQIADPAQTAAGWKTIAEHLGCSIASARRWAGLDGGRPPPPLLPNGHHDWLPVYTGARSDGVEAFSPIQLLREWQLRRLQFQHVRLKGSKEPRNLAGGVNENADDSADG